MGAIILGLLFVLLVGPAIWLPSLLGWRVRSRTLQRLGVAALLGDQAARWLYVGLGGLVTLIGFGFIGWGAVPMLSGDTPRASHVPGRSELEEVRPHRVLPDIRLSSQCLVFSPDGDRLLTGGSKLQLWNVATGSLQKDLALPRASDSRMAYRAEKMATSHKHVVLSLLGSEPGLGRWDWEEDTAAMTVVPIPIQPTALAIAGDGRYAFALESHPFGSDDVRRQHKPFVVVDFQEQKAFELFEPRIEGVAFPAGTNEALLASSEGLHLMDAGTRQIVSTIDLPGGAGWRGCLDFSVSADGRRAVACDRQALWSWTLPTGKPTKRLPFAKSFAAELELSADGGTLVTRGFVDDGALGVWQPANLQPRHVLVPADGEAVPYIDFAISPRGRYVAAVQRDQCLLWELP